MNPLLSVVIPTFNRRDSVARLLALLDKQTIASDLQVILVDQNDRGVLEKEIGLSRFRRVKHVWQQDPNVSLARNEGVRNSDADSILFLDDDVTPGPGFCAAGLALMERYPFAHCIAPRVLDSVQPGESMIHVRGKLIAKVSEELFEITDTMSAALFMSKEAFYRSGGFDVLLFDFARTAEDEEFFLRLKFKGLKLFYAPGLVIDHDTSQAGGCDLRTADYWITREKCIRSWVYRHKIHTGGDLRLGAKSMYQLYRSVFLNRSGLGGGTGKIRRQVDLLRSAIRDADGFLQPHKGKYRNPAEITHLDSAMP